MGYEAAKSKAWEELVKLNPGERLLVKFLADEYVINLEARKVISLGCNVPAKDFPSVLILHYLIQKLKGLAALTNEWLPFRELSGIEGYYPAFKKRAIEPIISKYGKNPGGIFAVLERLPSKKAEGADAAIILETFAGVPILIRLWGQDEEFGPDANIFFDKSITQIFCTEDIVVLAGIAASNI